MHLRRREGRFLRIKGERNRRSTVGKSKLLEKEGGAPNSYFSPKRKTNAALALDGDVHLHPRGENAPCKPQYGQMSHLRTQVCLLFQGCKVPYERLQRTPVREKASPGAVRSLEGLEDQRFNSDPKQ